MLVRLLYVSRAAGPQTTTVTAAILLAARAGNQANDVGGVLCQGQGLYLQMLEGERADVNRVYARIVGDRRHFDLEILRMEEVAARRFANWSMAHVELSEHEPMVSMKHPEFDPYSASADSALALLDALAASGHTIELPAS